ncbi:guanylate kinase [Candidatus Defluviicoccus seviourii]|uniref:Guanylate kinase n=1 Tax=Candidatus Defluviicoccus seviourii TaxID=2565273 RepID=A0A564WB48_9PROT|nr:guanylate kinase [Candidatus Defluviicoccus seviourii]
MSEAAATEGSAIARRGLMLVLSSPSGAGKSSIAHGLLATEAGLQMSVSVTTRPPRPGEIDGRHYSFASVEAFAALADSGRLLEHAVVFGNRYGTPREPVEAALAAGSDVLFDVDWQGAQQLRASAGDDVVSVFILPPSQTELERRLRGRGQDSDDVVRARMARASAEMSHWGEYDYVVVNRELSAATADVRAILAAERLRRRRQVGLAAFVATVSGT